MENKSPGEHSSPDYCLWEYIIGTSKDMCGSNTLQGASHKHELNVQAKDEVAAAGSGDLDCVEDKWSDYNRQRRAPCQHIPFKTDAELESTDSATYIGLKRNTDATHQIPTVNQPAEANAEHKSTSASPTVAFLQYFITISKRGNDSQIDLERLNTLLENGADINSTDRYGQGVLHGAARTWHPDVARFLIEKNANVNMPDNYGVTPLHVAAAIDYSEMVDFFLDCDVDIEAKTTGMIQTPVHYAAKYDAASSLNCLLKHGADINARDYKQRTPLQLATDLDRTESARLLLQFEADAGTYDNTGQLCLTLMAANMPQLAYTALDQFLIKDRPNRKQYLMLNMLVPRPSGLVESFNCYCSHCAHCVPDCRGVHRNPLFKYKVFSLEGVESPGNNERSKLMPPTVAREQHLALNVSTTNNLIVDFRTGQLRIHEFCLHRLNGGGVNKFMFLDMNLFDWLVYLLLFALIGTYAADLSMSSDTIHTTHIRLCAVTTIFLWLRVMKHVRAIRALGPFIVMLGKIIVDLLKFLFLYGEFYIPFACAFWIIFGGLVPNMATIPQMLFTVFRITLVDDYGFDEMYLIDPVMAYLLCGTFLGVSSILCINLLIALLSDTFQRVYDNANANAAMQQASIVLYVEDHLSKEKTNAFQEFIQTSCAPLEIFFDDDITIDQEDDLKKVTIQIKEDIDNLASLLQKEEWEMPEQSPGPRRGKIFFGRGHSENLDEESISSMELHDEIERLQSKVSDIYQQQESTTLTLTNEMRRTQDLINEILKHIGSGGSVSQSPPEST
ncbi:uncharacterized protein LOC129696067 [Leucoraja erinacea]|uniref:uncharacterized protein LOC129696067 n=1 Tax=Leucoraja erinaceus TaxID=7782 RepID=UPI00245723C7|nr:uncharacterized protein LOC129696067 [Leucoraja erinacea]